MSVRVELLSPAREAAWEAFVDAHPDSTCYHCRTWQVAARAAYGTENLSLVAVEANEVRGILPLMLVRNPLFTYAVTGIFGAYGRVLADSDKTRLALLDAAKEVAFAKGARHVLHKTVGDEPAAPGWSDNQSAAIATLSLTPGPDRLWKTFRGEIRNRVRKAEKHSLQVCLGRDELIPFCDVLAANMHRKGTPIYGLAFMRSLLDAFSDRAYVMTLRRESEPIAGALVIEHRGVVNVPFVSSLEKTFAIAPSNLLYWEIIKRSCERGQIVLDFGRSYRGTGNLDFKIRWGATVIPQPFHFIHLGPTPRLDPGDPTVKRLVGIWKRLPRTLADRLGPAICGRFLL